MTGIFLITKVMGVIDGSVTAQTAAAPTEPAMPTGNNVFTTNWTTYSAQIACYATQLSEWKHANSTYKDANSTAYGIFSSSLDIGIWDQVKNKLAKEIWDCLKTKYGKEAFVEVLDDFRYLRDLKIDLSDPNPQLANFMHHYQCLPMEGTPKICIVSESMACLILLSNLLLATENVGSTSLYQHMLEEVIRTTTISNLTLDDVFDNIRSSWAARFGHLPPSQHPHKSTFYVKEDKGKGPAIPSERPWRPLRKTLTKEMWQNQHQQSSLALVGVNVQASPH